MPTSQVADQPALPATSGLLGLVLDSLATAVGVLRAPDFRYEVANAACQVIAPGPSFVGRTFAEIAPGLAPTVVPLLRRVAETGEPFRAEDMRLDLPAAPGGPALERYFSFTYQRLPPDASGQPAVLATVDETTERVLARKALEGSLATERDARGWLERFRQLSSALASAGTAEEACQAALGGLAAFGAQGGWLALPTGDGRLRTVGAVGYPEATQAAFTTFEVAADLPISRAFRTREAVYAPTWAAVKAGYPLLRGAVSPWTSLAILPLLAGDEPVGVLGLGFEAPRPFAPDERARLEWLAQKCAQALERARLSDAERRALRWLERLQAATAAASAAATPAAVADEVVRAGLHALGAASVAVFALDGGTLRAVATHGLGAPDQARLSPLPATAPLPVAEAARRGQPIFLGSPEAQVRHAPALAELEASRGQRALAVLPMLARGQVVGVLRVGFVEARRFDAAERSFLEALASQAGLALERARGYEAEQRARAEAARVGALQEQLLAVVGHDLRTPLAAITLSAGLLQRRGGLAPPQAEAVARILQGSSRMARLIRDLMDFSRVRQGLGLSLHPARTDLARLAHQAVEEAQAAGAGVPISLACEGDGTIEGDPDRLAQVLANLLGNAVQHGAGTPIHLALLGLPADVVLEVRNGGPPVPPEVLPHVFEPFRRGGGAAPAGSVGLGLFIVREIVRAHGGEVTVRSAEEQGTCFTVRLPRPAGAVSVEP